MRHGLGAFLETHIDVIGAFLTSFLVIAVIWAEHHRLFESLVDYDTALLVLNFVWLFAIVALPFGTAVFQHAVFEDHRTAVFYLSILLVAFIALAGMHWIARHDPKLINPERRDDFEVGPNFTVAAMCVVAMVLALAVPDVGPWAVFVIVLADPVWLAIKRLLRRDNR